MVVIYFGKVNPNLKGKFRREHKHGKRGKRGKNNGKIGESKTIEGKKRDFPLLSYLFGWTRALAPTTTFVRPYNRL